MTKENVNHRCLVNRALIVLTVSCIALLFPCVSVAQESIRGKVFSGSSDNEATITVNNPDDEFIVENLELSLLSEPEWITNIRIKADGSGELRPGATRVYTIKFDVRDGAPDGTAETIIFEVKAERGMVEYPNPQIIVQIDQSKDTQDTDTGAVGEPLLNLVDVEWTPPSDTWKKSDIRHNEGEPGFCKYWSDGEQTEVRSLGFTAFPQKIELGRPFDIVVEGMWSGTKLVSICNIGPVVIAMPDAYLDIGSKTSIGGEFLGETLTYSCPEGVDRVLKSYQELMRISISFQPVSESGTEYNRSYVYRLAVNMEGGGKPWGDGETFSVSWEWDKTNKSASSSGINIRLNRSSSPTMGNVRLRYGVLKDSATVAEVPPYQHPPEATQVAEGKSQDTGVSDNGESESSETEGTGTEVKDVSGSGADGQEDTSAEDLGRPPGRERSTPVNPGALDPDTDPEVASMVKEWLSIAEPPENAVPGNNYHYDKFGRMTGSGEGMRTIRSHDTVEYGTGTTPEAKVWSDLRTKLDSVNHCTLEEYVVARLEGRSIANCRGRYTAVKSLKGKSLRDAKVEIGRAGLKYEVKAGSAANSVESDGTVEKQEPGPKNHLKSGTTLKIYVYGPYVPPRVAVPRVTNMKFDDAVKALKKKDFEVERDEIENTISEGKNFIVKAQEPEANEKAEKGSVVKLEVYGLYSYFNDALTALETCDAAKVTEFIAKMPRGREKSEIEKKNKALTEHLGEIEKGKQEAEEKFDNECFAEAIDVLNGLLSSARCPNESDVIEGLISEYDHKSRDRRDELKMLTDSAMVKYKEGCFDEALGVLNQVLDNTRCEGSKRKLNELVKKVTVNKERKDKEIDSATRQALSQLEKGCYSDALTVMNNLVDRIRCPAGREEAEELIAGIESERADTRKTMDTALQSFEQGCFEDAANVLNGLKDEIKCEKHVAEINKLIDKVEGRRAQLNKMMSEALSKFESGCYEEAESILQGIAAEIRCEKYRTKIEGFLSRCGERRAALRSEMNNAVNKYEAGDYGGALNILESMLRKQICEPQRTKVEELIARMTSIREPLLMPDLTGMHVDDAASAVRNIGMTPNVKKDKTPDNRDNENRVYAQNPSANTPLQPGATVNIYAYTLFAAVDRRQGVPGNFAGTWKCVGEGEGSTWVTENTMVVKQRGSDATATYTITVGVAKDETETLSGTVRGNKMMLSISYPEYKYEGTFNLSGDGKSINGSAVWYNLEAGGTPEYPMSFKCSKQAGDGLVTPRTSFVGSWTGTAHYDEHEEVTIALNFSIDGGYNARGTISYEQDIVNLDGTLNGSSLSMSGQQQLGKIELSGSLHGSSAQGTFGMTTYDVECVLQSTGDDAYNCPLTTYEGSWTAKKDDGRR